MVTLKEYTDCHNSYKAHGPISNNNTVTVKAIRKRVHCFYNLYRFVANTCF